MPIIAIIVLRLFSCLCSAGECERALDNISFLHPLYLVSSKSMHITSCLSSTDPLPGSLSTVNKYTSLHCATEYPLLADHSSSSSSPSSSSSETSMPACFMSCLSLRRLLFSSSSSTSRSSCSFSTSCRFCCASSSSSWTLARCFWSSSIYRRLCSIYRCKCRRTRLTSL